MTGTLVDGSITYTASSWYHTGATTISDDVHVGHTLDNVATATAKLANRTNPGRIVTSIPQFIGELKDFPSMLRRDGNNLLRHKPSRSSAGGAYLEWTFAWVPLYRDLSNFLNATGIVDSRVKELRSLYENGGLKRRLKLGQSGQHADSDLAVSTIGTKVFRCTLKGFTKGDQWGTCRWVPTALPTDMSNQGLRKIASDAVYGKSGNHISDVWNLLPWSWMIDWVSNTGDFIESHANTIPCDIRDICIMRHLLTTWSWKRSDAHTWAKGGEGEVRLETKERFMGSYSLSASIPFLNGGQLSILGALIASRRGF